MNILKGWITTSLIILIVAVTLTSANAGIIVTGRNVSTDNPCVDQTSEDKVDSAIIVTGLGGIIVTGLTGVIIPDFSTDVEPTNCGIIVTG